MVCAGCQGLVTDSFVLIEPPAITLAQEADEVGEQVPTLGPGTTAPASTRLAQPTMKLALKTDPGSAAPGAEETRSLASAKTMLLKATQALEKNQLPEATIILSRYLQAFPDATLIRLQLGELYFKLQQFERSRLQFQTALGEITDPPLTVSVQLHGHSRLMELAAENKDRFTQELQRGIGLLILARHRLLAPANTTGATAQELCGKAQTALQQAAELSPADARPFLYLALVWRMMHLQGNADCALECALTRATSTSLSEVERVMLAELNMHRQSNHVSSAAK